jgi:D-tyrosyl-tRNA(Tyr) deacylase
VEVAFHTLLSTHSSELYTRIVGEKEKRWKEKNAVKMIKAMDCK